MLSFISEETNYNFKDRNSFLRNKCNNIETVRNSCDLQEVSYKDIMCILFKNGRIAASYFKLDEKVLYVLNEMSDIEPTFLVMRTLLNDVNPYHIVTLGTCRDSYVQFLTDYVKINDTFADGSDQNHFISPKLFLLSAKEYSYKICEYRVKSLRLISEPSNMGDREREIYLNSFINFQSRMTVHVLGTLIKFTEKAWAQFSENPTDKLSFYHIKEISLMNHVFIDKNTFNALQIFQTLTHDASFKRGNISTSREGISMYRLFSQYCQSKIGCLKLRNILRNPINNETELNKRLDFIHFAQQPSNLLFIKSIQANIKNIADVSMILRKIEHSRGSNRDWRRLYKTLYNILFLNEQCGPYREQSHVFNDLANSVSENLYGLERCIDNTLDFNAVITNNRPVIKSGLDNNLDKNKMIIEDITTIVTAAAKMVVNQLPYYLNECTVIYIPDMGHVVAVNKNDFNSNKTDLQPFGFRFMFELNQNFHYKNALCEELDRYLSYVQHQIMEHENRIVERVASFVLRYNNDIREPIQIIALIDCLISMAKVVSEKEYIRPQFNQDNKHEIIEGRHPLLELGSCSYVSNDFFSGGSHCPIKMITGPNASGKSIYMKQVAVLIYLAHIGSYIPAASANIAMVYSIHSRMMATESAILQLSSFMIDLTQMSHALYNAKASSIILLDEFGRGTTGCEGVTLLMGALKKFTNQQTCCPHILVSTHLNLPKDIVDNSCILYQKMKYTRDITTNEIIFLYKIIKGISSSYAIEIASSLEIDPNITSRASKILNMYDEDFNNIKVQKYMKEAISGTFLTNIVIPKSDE